jgi:RNA polymerase sigma-70 factor (ECF subfamily)
VEPLSDLVVRVQRGDVSACGGLVEATQAMVFAVCCRILRDPGLAEDASQEAFLRAFRRLRDLEEPAAFPGWLRRIAVTVAMNMRRARRGAFLCLEEGMRVPILDELETRWSDVQREQLAAALVTLSREERRLCDRRYHGGWSIARLARDAGVEEAAMRKRLQRIRERLRKEIEVAEQNGLQPMETPRDLPARILELLARPQLTHLPENPVGRIAETLRRFYSSCTPMELPEVIDLAAARQTTAKDAVYVEDAELHYVDERRILRYDLTLPLLLSAPYRGTPLAIWAEGKAYRCGRFDTTHLEAFHQAEVFCLDERARLDVWQFVGRVLQSLDAVLPNCTVRMLPTRYPMCAQAWDLEVDIDGRPLEVIACGLFTDSIVSHLGADPARHIAVGAGYGLERLATLRYGIDDVRKIENAVVSPS